MKSITEMIEVMTACDNGAVIDFAANGPMKSWHYCECPRWDWANFDYRVSPRRRVSVYKALCKTSNLDFFLSAAMYPDEESARRDLSFEFVRLLPETKMEVMG